MSKFNDAMDFMFGTPIGAYTTGVALSFLTFYAVDRLDRWYKNKALALYEKGFNDAKEYSKAGFTDFELVRDYGLNTVIVKPVLPLKTEPDVEVDEKNEDDTPIIDNDEE